MPRYADAPLDEGKFRLFKINLENVELEISVKTFTLWRAPRYEAISYTWGDKSYGTTIITCNGEGLEVWQNLYSALQRLHREQNSSWLWSDAICIEQEGEIGGIEKARQIAFMETIFPAAEPVRIWLGEASEEEERALIDLAAMCLKQKESRLNSKDRSQLPEDTNRIWTLWAQVLLKPWFTRLWIIQEALLTREVVVTLGANAVVPWQDFRIIVETAKTPWYYVGLKYDSLDDRSRDLVNRDFEAEHKAPLSPKTFDLDKVALQVVLRNYVNIMEMTFLDRNSDRILQDGFFQQILKVYGNRKCTYDQDRPNAMRGVLPKRLKKGLKVYGIDADVATVYREVSRHWLTNDPTLSLLQRVRPLKKFLPENDQALATRLSNPSWALDLGRVLTDSLASDSPSMKDGFHAGQVRNGTKYEWSVPPTSVSFRSLLKSKVSLTSSHVSFPSEFKIQVTGLQIGTVTDVLHFSTSLSNDLLSPSATAQHFATYKAWLNDTLHLIQDTIANATDATETHWRTLVHNRADYNDPAVTTLVDIDSSFSRHNAYRTLLQILNSNPEGSDHDHYEQQHHALTHTSTETRDYYHLTHIIQPSFPNWFSTSTTSIFPLPLPPAAQQEQKHIGRSYAAPQKGDVVAVFYGAATPFLLRPVLAAATAAHKAGSETGPGQNEVDDAAAATYEFMGEAYVHGIMQGEALLVSSSSHKNHRCPYDRKTFMLV